MGLDWSGALWTPAEGRAEGTDTGERVFAVRCRVEFPKNSTRDLRVSDVKMCIYVESHLHYFHATVNHKFGMEVSGAVHSRAEMDRQPLQRCAGLRANARDSLVGRQSQGMGVVLGDQVHWSDNVVNAKEGRFERIALRIDARLLMGGFRMAPETVFYSTVSAIDQNQ